MVEPRRADEMSAEVLRVLDGTAPEVRFLIMRALLQQSTQWRFPQLDWEEGEQDSKFVCPHCIADLEELKLVEYILEEDDETSASVDDQIVYFEGADLDSNANKIVICPRCKLPVTLPSGWETEWG